MNERRIVNELKEEATMLRERNTVCEGLLLRQQNQIQTIQKDILHLKSQQMRDNVIISGISEGENETQDILFNKVSQFMKDELKMDEHEIRHLSYDRMHRIGRRNADTARIRDILIKFSTHGCKNVLMRHIKNLRRGTKYFVSDQFPPEINERRRVLQKVRAEKKAEDRHVRLVADQLYVDGKLHPSNPPEEIFTTDMFTKVKSLEVSRSERFCENGISYQGHKIQFDDNVDPKIALVQLFREQAIARASHNIWVCKRGSVTTRDDDGLYGGSFKVAEIVNQQSTHNCMVVVSVWNNGQLISSEHFPWIQKATKDAMFVGVSSG